jgi:hypothetical protein
MHNSLKKRLFVHLYSILVISCTFALVQKKLFFYLFISCIQKKNNSFILVYFCQRSQAKLFLQNLQKTTQEQFFLYQRKSAWND